MQRWLILTLACSLAAACSPAMPPDSPTNSQTPGPGGPPAYAPRPGDDQLVRGAVYLDSADVLVMESYPVQIAVLLKGSLPTPCHELRVAVNEPDEANRIRLEVYSVSDPNAVCAQMLKSFEQSVYLGSYPAGHYTIWIDERQIGEFDS